MKLFHFSVMLCILLVISCQKENSCEDCLRANKPPVANAGSDLVINIPLDRVLLDGSSSKDDDGSIVAWQWELIAGPHPVKVVNKHLAKTFVHFSAVGTYLFELTVRDNTGITAKDSLQVSVNPSLTEPSPQETDGNLVFYFPDPTSSMDSAKIFNISFSPTLTLVVVKIDNNMEGYIAGMWCKSCEPRCPISTDYLADPAHYTSFKLPPGTYTWTAETVFQNFKGYPFNSSPFPGVLINFFAKPHKTSGTVTISANGPCFNHKIVF